jgi:hypothetical protein
MAERGGFVSHRTQEALQLADSPFPTPPKIP